MTRIARAICYQAALILIATSCTISDYQDSGTRQEIVISMAGSGYTKALNPDADLVSDINLFIFNSRGLLETRRYFTTGGGNGCSCTVSLGVNCEYSFYACANLGYELQAEDLESLKNARCHLAYPDDYKGGLPMCGTLENIRITGREIRIPMERMMAEISLQIDRSKLNTTVEFNVRSVKVGGCPRSALLFEKNSVRSVSEVFPSGFLRSGYETDPLNVKARGNMSEAVTLYILENAQGDLLPGNTLEEKKFFEEGNNDGRFCSFVEMKIEYLSDKHYTANGKFLIYRFYIGTNPENFDVLRNRRYSITVIPQGDGLEETHWRIDTENVYPIVNGIELSNKELRFSYLGESREMTAYISPEEAGDVLLEWMSSDESVAEVSSTGVVTAKGEGSCKITCHASNGNLDPKVSAECDVTVKVSPYYMKVYPGNYIKCMLGDEVVVRCDFFPPNAEFDIGLEELETDRERGIYDYEIGEDGRSVTLKTLKRGSGLLYMETGPPVSQAELIVLVVD